MLALVTNVGTVISRLPLYESIPLAILVLALTGVVLKMARDEWWTHYLERQILALQLVERGVLIVYSRPKSDHPA